MKREVVIKFTEEIDADCNFTLEESTQWLKDKLRRSLVSDIEIVSAKDINTEEITEETIQWFKCKPKKQKEYLVTLANGWIDVLTYYPNDDIWMDDFDGEEVRIVSWAEKPKGLR